MIDQPAIGNAERPQPAACRFPVTDARPATMPYRLLDCDGNEYLSEVPGTLGGYRPRKIYGRLDCASALRAIAKGGYVQHRVFFVDTATATAAGYRPCAKCCPAQYRAWQAAKAGRG